MISQVTTADDAQIIAARESGASDSDLSIIANLKERAREFEAARLELTRMGPAVARTNDYDLMVEYGELVNRADSIKSKIATAMQAIDSSIRWARGTFGVSGMATLSSLGLVWFLPAAVIAAAIAVIGYWINDYMKFSQRFDQQARIASELQAQGMDPSEANRQAAAAVAATAPAGFFTGLGGNIAIWAALLLVGALAFREWGK